MPREQITHNPIVEQRISRQTFTDPDVPDAIVHVETPRRIDVTVAELRGMLAAAEDEAKAEARRRARHGPVAVPHRVGRDGPL